MNSRTEISKARRVILKIGSSSLTGPEGASLQTKFVDLLVDAVATLRKSGAEVLVVSSGAIATGLAPLKLQTRPNDLALQQAAASVGQGLLMHRYTESLSRYSIIGSQVLLTIDDVNREEHFENAKQTIQKLLQLGVVPIVNENDSVGTQEIKFGDNDRLAALVAKLINADLLILISDVDGLYDGEPTDKNSKIINEVLDFKALDNLKLQSGAGSKVGSGGMVTKIEAAKIASEAAIATVLTSLQNLGQVIKGEPVGTFFHPQNKSGQSNLNSQTKAKKNGNENDRLIERLAQLANTSAQSLRNSSIEERRDALAKIAQEISLSKAEILQQNLVDYQREEKSGLSKALLDRLKIDETRIAAIIGGVKKVSELPDPLNKVLNKRELENGLILNQITVPFGVVGMIYEARPNVTVDAAAILIMSGNAALLRGSASAQCSNEILVKVIKRALSKTKFSPDLIQLIPSDNRDTTRALLQAKEYVDLVIPRGSAQLINMVVAEAKVPTIETGAGVCHVYVDASADLAKALPIILNAKTQRPSVCNAAETLLINKDIADEFVPTAIKALDAAQVKLNVDVKTLEIAKNIGINAKLATEQSWSTEYGDLEINVAIVNDCNQAIEHINKFGTKHTEAIITEDQNNAAAFIANVDCAAVMVNASTRFTDGEEMGFGAEIGISNQKLHARGPMGLEQMTTTKWIVRGSGQIRK